MHCLKTLLLSSVLTFWGSLSYGRNLEDTVAHSVSLSHDSNSTPIPTSGSQNNSSATDSPQSFDVTTNVYDTNGADISDQISIQLHEGGTAPPAVSNVLSKRTLKSRPLNHCNKGEFDISYCLRAGTIRAYTVVCDVVPHLRNVFSHDSCGLTEVCVNGPDEGNHNVSMASCVSLESGPHFDITQAQGDAVAGYTAGRGGQYAVSTVLAERDGVKSLFARNLSIQAQTYDTYPNAQVWFPLAGGEAHCKRCASVGIGSIPAETKRLSLNVMLEAGAVGGILYLVLIKVS